jgi:hypothetical protein
VLRRGGLAFAERHNALHVNASEFFTLTASISPLGVLSTMMAMSMRSAGSCWASRQRPARIGRGCADHLEALPAPDDLPVIRKPKCIESDNAHRYTNA